MKRVLVFDSGVGGLSVLDAIAASGHALELDYVADNAWLPYGLKSDAELRARVPALLTRMVEQWAPELVVVACNTASTIVLDAVRSALAIPVVGVVPPIKPAAALTRTGVIGLLATPATVRRAYTNDLITQFAPDKRVVRFGSSALVEAAESKLRGEPSGEAAITEAMEGLFGAPGGGEIDVVALACTHFPLLAQELAAAAPRSCVWLDSGEAIARRVANVLISSPGQARTHRAAFTDAAAASELFPAFQARGFTAAAAVSGAPHFDVQLLSDFASV
ncbi:glutamate racemase [Vitreimonas flagellata]|uniref:glutamate racemase n=1 Tax=Vitreimonas flagellata TaxID=2560861 RepID=UPI0010750773|nr:glutamate racemase [Vitreimonas flagellata]